MINVSLINGGLTVNNFKIELPEHVKFIIHTLQAHGFEAYAVGGCVRDSMLGREPGDWDITTSALEQTEGTQEDQHQLGCHQLSPSAHSDIRGKSNQNTIQL